MHFVEILILAVALSIDACAVSLAASTSGYTPNGRAVFRLAFHFGLFQFLMPVLGWLLGSAIAPIIDGFDHWLAFGLLAFIGIRMLRFGTHAASPEPATTADPTRGWTLVMLATATSIDALAVGLTLAMLRVPVWYPGAVIGLVTALICLAAIQLGCRLGAWLGPRAQAVGGLVLLIIGVRILITGLAGSA